MGRGTKKEYSGLRDVEMVSSEAAEIETGQGPRARVEPERATRRSLGHRVFSAREARLARRGRLAGQGFSARPKSR